MERRGKSPSFHNKARKKREKQEKMKVAKTQKKGKSYRLHRYLRKSECCVPELLLLTKEVNKEGTVHCQEEPEPFLPPCWYLSLVITDDH